MYNKPKIKINKVYTKSGDSGKTKLTGGQTRLKSDLRIDCYGEIDELNSNIGACIVNIKNIEICLNCILFIINITENAEIKDNMNKTTRDINSSYFFL